MNTNEIDWQGELTDDVRNVNWKLFENALRVYMRTSGWTDIVKAVEHLTNESFTQITGQNRAAWLSYMRAADSSWVAKVQMYFEMHLGCSE